MTPIEQNLQTVLARHATQEFIDSVLVAQQCLQEHQYTDHELELINILEVENPETLLQEVHDGLFVHINNVCAMHRLRVNQDAGITEVSKLARALLLMQFWEDKDTIVSLCESDAEDEDKLAALVALVGELTENQACDVIESIDPNFMRGLARLYTTDAFSVEDPAQLQIPPEQITKLRAWRSIMHAERTLAFRMVKAGYQPGATVEQYFQRATNSLSEKDNKAIAAEVLPFVLLGRDGWENPLKAWREHSHLLNLELIDVQGIDVEITKLLSEFDRLNTQGPAK